MLNLLKYKDHAEYEDGRETDLTGAEAYGVYASGVGQEVRKVGGMPMFSASVERLMLGEVEELWDAAAIVMLQVFAHGMDHQVPVAVLGKYRCLFV